MAGSNPFSIDPSPNFKRSFKKLVKANGKPILGLVSQALEELTENPYPLNSRLEPLPSKLRLPDSWSFHKLELRGGQGASGQIRLMYLVNSNTRVIAALWIYSHEQFAKRPADKELRKVIKEILA